MCVKCIHLKSARSVLHESSLEQNLLHGFGLEQTVRSKTRWKDICQELQIITKLMQNEIPPRTLLWFSDHLQYPKNEESVELLPAIELSKSQVSKRDFNKNRCLPRTYINFNGLPSRDQAHRFWLLCLGFVHASSRCRRGRCRKLPIS